MRRLGSIAKAQAEGTVGLSLAPFSTVLYHTAELAVMNDTLFSRDVSIWSLKYFIEPSGAVWT